MMHSLSGGTGSGLGSRLIEALREEYGLCHLMSCAFAPHMSGESPLQHYNSLLTLATLQRYSLYLIYNKDTMNHLYQPQGRVRDSWGK